MARVLLIASAVFIIISALVVFVFSGYRFLGAPSPMTTTERIYSTGRLILHKHALVKRLKPVEKKLLYEASCVRKCHSRGVIEDAPRTAREWDWIVNRMQERASLSRPQTVAISEYLQENYLSTVPTILPEKVMRFMKKHLWKVDFGQGDLYLDLIYVPMIHRGLHSYLGINETPVGESADFVVYINTHQSFIPPWDLKTLATVSTQGGKPVGASAWDVIFEDSQQHHRQGILSFPLTGEIRNASSMEISIKLPGLREKSFIWTLPVPPFEGDYEPAS